MGRISASQGLDILKKWAVRRSELLVVYGDPASVALRETPAQIVVTASNELEISQEGVALLKANLDAAEFSELPESSSSKFVETLEVKFHDGKSLVFREPRQHQP